MSKPTQVRLLYTTDFNHTHLSKTLIAAFTDKVKFRRTVLQLIEKELELNDDETKPSVMEVWEFFKTYNQTQQLTNFELIVETVEANTFIVNP
jgi:hypothetical protein